VGRASRIRNRLASDRGAVLRLGTQEFTGLSNRILCHPACHLEGKCTMTDSPVLQRGTRRTLPPPDARSVRSCFEIFAAPRGDRSSIQIVRPFSVLSKNTYSAPLTLPIGPAYLAAVLERAGYNVSIIDAVGEDIYRITRSQCNRVNLQGILADEIIDRLDVDVRVVGGSMMFSQEWCEHRNLIRAIRMARPNAIIVAGGEHVTAATEYVLRDCPEIDFAVIGEGELPFLELCHAILHDTSTENIGGT